jgi:hypothetical protein
MQSRPVLYSRDLPGGGFVAIDTVPDAQGHRARLWVERRGDLARRAGHFPPVIVECDAHDVDAAMAELRPIASDNLALAQAIRRWQAARGR